MPQIVWKGASTQNFDKSRVDPETGITHKPIAIVCHIMEGTLDGTASWFQNPKAQASTNYGIGKDGRIFQFVADEDRPYANGLIQNPSWSVLDRMKRPDGTYINPNLYTESIEHEGHTGDAFTEEQYQATLWLQQQLITKFGIPVDRDHIIGHYRIDSVTRARCPGSGFPWDRLFNDLLIWSGQPVNSNEKYPDGTIGIVTANLLNIRDNPETGNIVAQIPNGVKLTVLEVSGNWCRVKLDNGTLAWAYKDLLNIIKPIPAPIPVPTPTVTNPIMGKNNATLEQMVGFVQKVNPNFDPEIAKAFLAVGEKYGIRGDVAFCQSIHETHYFIFDMGTAVTSDQHNYCGLGVTQKGLKGASFATIKDGVSAQIQHLFAYATTATLPAGELLLDPRFDLVTRGIAPGWEDLNGRWAVPGPTYGQSILAIHLDILKFMPPAPKPELPWQQKLGVDSVAYLKSIGQINNPADWPAEKMDQSAPIWLVMSLIARSQGMK